VNGERSKHGENKKTKNLLGEPGEKGINKRIILKWTFNTTGNEVCIAII
jgi:hypothetical protein